MLRVLTTLTTKARMPVTALIDGNQVQLNSAVQKPTKHKKKTK